MIRDVTFEDLAAILELNTEFQHVLSSANAERIAYLYDRADYRRVFQLGSRVIGFLLAMKAGNSYDGENYNWFSERYANFLYIDRVAISREHHRQCFGEQLYLDLFLCARHMGVSHVTCEIDADPPNLASQRFHEKFGFRQVGTRVTGLGMKPVSMQAVALTDWAASRFSDHLILKKGSF
jgi:predicted GNAT superfamily acetyltransferase